MPSPKQTSQFSEWIQSIPDIPTQVRLVRRIDRLSCGLMGDVKSVGDGVFELRESFGPGWRIYFSRLDAETLVLLWGGSKRNQSSDIEIAKKLWRSLRREHHEKGDDR